MLNGVGVRCAVRPIVCAVWLIANISAAGGEG